MDWLGICEFVAVGQTQSFTKAANKLGISVVNVSRRVKALEQRLGIKLLQRTTRHVALTEAGKLYFDECRQLVDGLAIAELKVTQMQHTAKGLIKVTAPVTYGERYIAPLINDFLRQYPEVEIDLVLTNQRLDLVENGFDVAIRLGHLKDSNHIAKRLASRQLYVCASPSYLEKYGEPHSLSELSHHQCLVGSVDYWHFMQQGKQRNLKVNGRLKCNSGISLLDAAINGIGLVQLPDYYVKDALQSGSLVEVLANFRDKEEGIWALYAYNRNLPSKVALLLDYLQQSL